jgi:hypothetical protein
LTAAQEHFERKVKDQETGTALFIVFCGAIAQSAALSVTRAQIFTACARIGIY